MVSTWKPGTRRSSATTRSAARTMTMSGAGIRFTTRGTRISPRSVKPPTRTSQPFTVPRASHMRRMREREAEEVLKRLHVDDGPDARREAGRHRVRNELDELAEPHRGHGDEDDPGETAGDE